MTFDASFVANWPGHMSSGLKGGNQPSHLAAQTMPRLPIADAGDISQEVVDMIIDQLVGDIPSLRACTLLCHRWRPRSRYQLFRSVKITNENEEHSVHRWCSMFPVAGGM